MYEFSLCCMQMCPLDWLAVSMHYLRQIACLNCEYWLAVLHCVRLYSLDLNCCPMTLMTSRSVQMYSGMAQLALWNVRLFVDPAKIRTIKNINKHIQKINLTGVIETLTDFKIKSPIIYIEYNFNINLVSNFPLSFLAKL